MKKISSKKIVQIAITFISWLTISPLFCTFAKRFQLLPKMWRVLLLLVSPLFLLFFYVMAFVIPIASYFIYDGYFVKYRFADNDVLERITGVEFPEVEIRKYYRGGRSFTGDYTDVIILQLEEIPDQNVIEQLESVCSKSSNWSKDGSFYRFSAIWGGDNWAPEGEDKNEQMSLFVDYHAGSDSLYVSYGAW